MNAVSDLTEPPSLDPARCALVVIDMQNDFCSDNGVFGRQGADLRAVQAIVPTIERLLASARERGVGRFLVRTTHSDATDSPTWTALSSRAELAITREGSWGAEWYRLEPAPGDEVVVKHRYSAFVGTDLALRLGARGIDTVILSGTATHVCVESTARDACMHDLRAVVVSDAVASPEEADHESSLRNVARYFGRVATADEVTLGWRRP
jgi:ureidoacrylate peracid hydrolase